jgi:hypothetical protein
MGVISCLISEARVMWNSIPNIDSFFCRSIPLILIFGSETIPCAEASKEIATKIPHRLRQSQSLFVMMLPKQFQNAAVARY